MFDVSTLTSIEAVENAVFELQGIINAANVGRILDDIILHERPAVVRLVLSGKSFLNPMWGSELNYRQVWMTSWL